MKKTKSPVSYHTEMYEPLTLDLYTDPKTGFFSEIYVEVCHLLDDRCSILGDIWVPMQCFSLYITQIPVHLDQIKEGRKAKT